MHLITYVSDFALPKTQMKQTLHDIVVVAKQHNPKHGITGVLFYIEETFLQVIEGEEANLRSLMTNIEADERHKNLTYLIDTTVEKRGFADWNMDSFILKNNLTFDKTTMSKLTENFSQNLLPRSDTLVYFYRSLLEEKVA